MSTARKIIVPAATIAAASQALMAIQPDVEQISIALHATAYDTIALDAVSNARGQEIIRRSQFNIVRALRIDQDLMSNGYAEVAFDGMSAERIQEIFGGAPDAAEKFIELAGTESHLMDSTTGGEAYFSCYNNCHSACHGSRGWR